MQWFVIIVGIMLVIIFILLIIELIRTAVVFKNAKKLIDAVFLYQLDCIDHDKTPIATLDNIRLGVYYDNPFIWTVKQMLPPDKYEAIKPYIGRKVEK